MVVAVKFSGIEWRNAVDLNALHLSLVVHVVDRQTALVDEVVDAGVHLDQQLICPSAHSHTDNRARQ